MCATLKHEDSEVIGNIENPANVVASLVSKVAENLGTMAHLHHTDAHAIVVDCAHGSLPENLLG